MSDPDKTPVDGPMTQLYEEMRDLKLHCMRVADSAMLASAEIPALKAQIRRITLFQAWFPTAAITVAIIVRLLWLR